MGGLRRGALVGGLILLLSAPAVLAQDFPAPQARVTDEVGVLSQATAGALETALDTLERDTSAEVAVVIVKSLDGLTVEDYAVRLFERWGIGKKDSNNGVLFLVGYAERELRIEVGYGLEAVITDGRAGRILDREVIPYLRKDDYDAGITAGVAAIEGYIRDGSPASPLEDNPVRSILDGFRLPMPLLITLGVITVYILGFMARSKSVWLGGIWGVILGLTLGFGFGRVLAIVLLPLGLGVVGTFLDLLLSANYRGRSASGLPTGWIPSRGGFSGPSGGFGSSVGSRSSGSFGGFGGGRSGGGGASRRF